MSEQPPREPEAEAPGSESRAILTNSAVMAAGTVLSRITGFARASLLVAALGSGLRADIFTTANTVPNMLYILLAGGIFNAVLVPQLVRSMKNDPDGGDAYANRVVTLAAVFLAVVTLLLVLVAPWLMRLFVGPTYADPALAAQLESVVSFARLCLPQVFFYGMFVLLAQILNARGRFGPMMWAPIANNLVAISMLCLYLFVHGPATRADDCAAYTSSQELLLGLGSTLGIVVQLAILFPYLRAVGFRFSPRLDVRGTGLGHTLRLGAWTVGFVIVNQIAYTVVVMLANGGTAQGVLAGCDAGAGRRAGVRPHRLRQRLPDPDGPARRRHGLAGHRRAAPALGARRRRRPRRAGAHPGQHAAHVAGRDHPVRRAAAGHRRPTSPTASSATAPARRSYELYAPALTIFGPALVFFTVHYLVLRGFYALERNRTAFYVQCVIGAVNITAALALVSATGPRATAAALAGAYLIAYAVGSTVSYAVLRRSVGNLGTVGAGALPGPDAAGHGRRHRVGVPALPAPARRRRRAPAPRGRGAVLLVVVAVDVAVFLGLARMLRITEVTEVLETVLGPLLRRRRRAATR